MSQLVESESGVARVPVRLQAVKGSPITPAIPFWQAAILAAFSLWLFAPTFYHLVLQWADTRSDFTHGFFVPLFSAFVIWQERGRLSQIPRKPSMSGLVLLAAALGVLVVGRLGVELFVARVSMLLLIAALVVLFLGWSFFRAILFPWAFLLLMIPLPTLVFNQITFPLQLLASRVAAHVLPLLGVPVLRAGNVMQLPNTVLNVAEACSGIRSLISLACLAIIYGYLMERRVLVRWTLLLLALPIAVAANSARIVGTGLVAQYWSPEKAHGFYHTFEGLLVFVVCLLSLYFAHALIRLVWPDQKTPAPSPSPIPTSQSTLTNSWPRFVFALLLLALAAWYLGVHSHREFFPQRLPLQSFPAQLGPWNGTDQTMDQETLDVLGPGEFLSRSYTTSAAQSPAIDFLIAYFPTQRNGDSIHSPMHCLPGSGWLPVATSRVTLSFPGHQPFPANRLVIAEGDAKQVVLYWYWSHDRGVASEYWVKYYLVKDSIQLHRSDGALVRLVTPVYPGENADAAYQRLLPFAAQTVPLLDDFIPR